MCTYIKGELITSLDELKNQDFVWFDDKVYPCGFFFSVPFETIKLIVESNSVFKVEKT